MQMMIFSPITLFIRQFKSQATYCMIIFLSLGFVCQTTQANLDQIARRQRELKLLSTQIDALQQKIHNSTDKNETLMDELGYSEKKINQLNVDLNKINTQIKQLPRAIRCLQQQITDNQNFLKQQQSILSKQIKTAYISGQRDFIKLLLQEESPERLSRFIEYYKSLNSSRHNVIQSIAQKRRKLNQDQSTLKASARKLNDAKQTELRKKGSLENSRDYRKIVLHEMHQELNSDKKQLEALEKNKQALSKVLTRLKHTQSTEKQILFSTLRHQLALPTRGNIIHKFGENILGGQLSYNGLFIQALPGERVSALYSGDVVFSNWLRNFGLVLIIDHGEGYMSLYAHNETLFKHTGDRVNARETIATVGHTGGRLQNGLYFELRHNGKPINPKSWFRHSS